MKIYLRIVGTGGHSVERTAFSEEEHTRMEKALAFMVNINYLHTSLNFFYDQDLLQNGKLIRKKKA